MGDIKITSRADEKPFTVGRQGTVHLVITGGTPPYTHVAISASTRAELHSNSITSDIRKHNSEAVIILTGVPREVTTISVVVEVRDSGDVLDNVSYPLKIHSDISDESITISNQITKARSGARYSCNISNANKNVKFSLDSVSSSALKDVGITMDEHGVLTADPVHTGINSEYEIGVVFMATKNNKPVNITNKKQNIYILPEVTLEFAHDYVKGNEIDSLINKQSKSVTFISNTELTEITPSVEIIDADSKVIKSSRFQAAVSGRKLTLSETDDKNELSKLTVGKYGLNIIGVDSYNNRYKWKYKLNILSKLDAVTVAIDSAGIQGAELIQKLMDVYEIKTDRQVNIPITITGGLRPFIKNNDSNTMYEGLLLSTVNGNIILSGKVTTSFDANYTKYKKNGVTISVSDRNSTKGNKTINLLVNMPPVGKNISADDAPEIGKGSEKNIMFDLFSDIDPELYPDYSKAYPSLIEIEGLPKFTGATVNWKKESKTGTVVFNGLIERKDAINIKYVTNEYTKNHGVLIKIAPNLPDGHLSFKFNIKNKNGSSSIARTVSIPIQDSMPIASLTLEHTVKVNNVTEIDPLKNSEGGPFDAVAISGESLSNIKGELKVIQNNTGQYRLSVMVNDHQGGTEDIVFYLIKGYRASKGKVTLKIQK